MKRSILTICVLALGVLTGCRSERAEVPAGEGYGYVNFACATSLEVETRAQLDVTKPDQSEFSLHITGSDYDQSWERLGDYNAAENRMEAGNYFAEVAWGDITQEGENLPCYAGTAQFEIIPQKTINVSIQATFTNAMVMVKFTEQFLNYFHDEQVTLTSAAGNEFEFDSTSTEPIFIAPGQFKLTGSALKQTGTEFVIPAQTREAKVCTLHTVTFDLSTAGSAQVIIKLDDTLVAGITVDTELNPDSE